MFFTSADAAAFCSYVLPELGNRVNIVDPDRLLLNQIPLEPVVQFYLDADRGPVSYTHLDVYKRQGQIRANADKLYATRRPAGRAVAAAEKPADPAAAKEPVVKAPTRSSESELDIMVED